MAVIGDIRGSREAEDRAALQERFQGALDGASTGPASLPTGAPLSGPTITTGDEFQALFEDAGPALGFAVRVTEAMHPARLRFGIGRGALETPLNEDDAIGMDGPCFHRARSAVQDSAGRRAWVAVEGFGERIDRAADATLALVAAVREGWTDRQREYASAYRELGVQHEVAERFDVAKSTVSESLAAARAKETLQALAATASLLDREAGP